MSYNGKFRITAFVGISNHDVGITGSSPVGTVGLGMLPAPDDAYVVAIAFAFVVVHTSPTFHDHAEK
jgi:hypothetical protein